MLNYSLTKKMIESRLKVRDREDSTIKDFILYPEQDRLLRTLCEEINVIVCKSRQIGSSTICLAYAALFALSHPGIDVGIVAKDVDLTVEFGEKLNEYFTNLKVEVNKTRQCIILPNKSRIKLLTAGSKTSGRGYSYSLLLCSEAAYYENSFDLMSALIGSLTKNCQIILESTAQAGYTHYRETWDGELFTKFFSPLEAHESYREDPNSISEARWLELQETYGFTRRDTAAFWDKMYNKFGRDEFRAAREYPVSPDHAFTYAEGRWVPVDPEILPYRLQGKSNFKVFEEPRPDWTGRYVLSVDVAAGGGGDDSVVIVWDVMNDRISAIWSDNNSTSDKLLDVIKEIHNYYKSRYVIIEVNGIGGSLAPIAVRDKLPVISHVSKAKDPHGKTTYNAFLWARNQIKDGLAADEALLHNCRSCCVKNTVPGKWTLTGAKDVLAAISFVGSNYHLVERLRKEPEPKVVSPNAFDAKKHLSAIKNKNRRIGGFQPL